MADLKTIGIIGAVALTAYFSGDAVDKMEADKRIDEATKIVAVAEVKEGVIIPAGYKYNPLIYATPSDTFEVTVRQVNKDTTLFIGKFASDVSALLDVNVNLQPSEVPKQDEPTKE